MSAFISATGNLGRDVQVRDVGNSKVANFSLASSAYDGKTKDYQTKWFNVELWGKQAEWAANKLAKGSKVWVCGEYINSHYEKDGSTKEASYVKASKVEMLSEPNLITQEKPEFNNDEIPF